MTKDINIFNTEGKESTYFIPISILRGVYGFRSFVYISAAGNVGYGIYGSTENDGNRKLQHMKTHQSSNTGQMDNSRPLEEMPFQVC